MKHLYGLLLIFLLISSFTALQAQRSCATTEVMEQQLREHSEQQIRLERIEEFTQRVIQDGVGFRDAITIPVVVHLLYHTDTENISDEQIHTQLQVLNEDFRRLNADAVNTPDIFQDRAADVQINFCLATLDPKGQPTTGIIRTKTVQEGFKANGMVTNPERGGVVAWPASQYLNIWVCNLESNYDYPLLGYAQYPGGNPATDGVVLNYKAFGRGAYPLFTLYNLGRSATHEIGHWLNLRHIWGGGAGCERDDLVSDTPQANGDNETEVPCAFPARNSCDEGEGDLPDMFQNFMDYSSDACMNLFTKGQGERMLALFAPGGPRESLLSSPGCSAAPIPTDTPISNEICDNQLDDDGDGLIDCADPDCENAPACPPFICESPAGLRTSQITAQTATLQWHAVEGADFYNLQIRKVGSTSWANTRSIETNYFVKRLSPNTAYEWRVRARCTDQLGKASVKKAFTTGQGNSGEGLLTDIQELSSTIRINVFPNPARDQFQVILEGNKTSDQVYHLFLIDITGRTVQQDRLERNAISAEINSSGLAQGLYLLKVVNKDGKLEKTVKILINK